MQNYSIEEIEFYSNSPYVKTVSQNKLVLTYEFKTILYHAWLADKRSSTIKLTLAEFGFNTDSMGRDYPKNLSRYFKLYGAPGSPLEKKQSEASKQILSTAAKKKLSLTPTEALLVSTGKFVYRRHKLSFPIECLVASRLKAAKEKAARRREAYLNRRQEKLLLKQSPACIVARDLEYLKRELSKWKKVKDLAESQIPYLEGVIKKTEKALSFIRQAAKETILQLKVPQNWQNYPELSYIFDMKGLF